VDLLHGILTGFFNEKQLSDFEASIWNVMYRSTLASVLPSAFQSIRCRSIHVLLRSGTGCNHGQPLPMATTGRRMMPLEFWPPCVGGNYRIQQRRLTSKKRKKQLELSKHKVCPFVTLGVSQKDKYEVVKKVFLKIAMTCHPDTSVAESKEKQDANKETFVSARKAFEEIVAGPDGFAILKSESPNHVNSEEDLDAWFKAETGHDMPFMDARTIREVAEMTEKIGGGLDRDGGMWTLARMVSNSAKSGGDGRDILQLEAGNIRDSSINGILRRKRRR
jgi:hypothetical protein